MPYPDSSAAIPAIAVEAATQALRANPDIPEDVQALLALEVALPHIRERIGRGGDVAAAIATIKFSRQTHLDWGAHFRRNPHLDAGDLGDAEWHEKCVREYDNVLAVLAAIVRGGAV